MQPVSRDWSKLRLLHVHCHFLGLGQKVGWSVSAERTEGRCLVQHSNQRGVRIRAEPHMFL